MVALFKSHVVSFYALASLECELSPYRTQKGGLGGGEEVGALGTPDFKRRGYDGYG